jgi:hypothetical protein
MILFSPFSKIKDYKKEMTCSAALHLQLFNTITNNHYVPGPPVT